MLRVGAGARDVPVAEQVNRAAARLQVIDRRTRANPYGRQALVRNLIKIALPWELGHTVALGYANPSGEPVHDRLAVTAVQATA